MRYARPHLSCHASRERRERTYLRMDEKIEKTKAWNMFEQKEEKKKTRRFPNRSHPITLFERSTHSQLVLSMSPISPFSDQRIQPMLRPWKKTESGYRNRRLLGGRICTLTHSLTIWSHPFPTHPLSLSVSDTCRCRSTWWGEIVNDASHRKSGSPGHATPSPCEPILFNWALFMKLDVAQNQTCKPAASFSQRRSQRDRSGETKKKPWNSVGKILRFRSIRILTRERHHARTLFQDRILGPSFPLFSLSLFFFLLEWTSPFPFVPTNSRRSISIFPFRYVLIKFPSGERWI